MEANAIAVEWSLTWGCRFREGQIISLRPRRGSRTSYVRGAEHPERLPTKPRRIRIQTEQPVECRSGEARCGRDSSRPVQFVDQSLAAQHRDEFVQIEERESGTENLHRHVPGSAYEFLERSGRVVTAVANVNVKCGTRPP